MPMNAAKLLLLNVLGGGSAVDTSASFTVTTTGAQTLTIDALTVSPATTVDWGDGSQDVYTGSGARTHNYAGAGTWTVRILEPLNVTTFQLSQNTLVTDTRSANLKRMVNVTSFQLYRQPAGSTGRFDSADVVDWRPAVTFRLYDMPTGYGGTFDSADVVDWRPADFGLMNMPTGYGGTFDSADVVDWRPAGFRLYVMPSSFDAVVSAAADFAGWAGCNTLYMHGIALTSTEVDRVLLGMNMAATGRTGTGGSIKLEGTNAAPSGTYASECPPTTGKGAAFNLLNNSCGTINAGRVWSSITVTGGL